MLFFFNLFSCSHRLYEEEGTGKGGDTVDLMEIERILRLCEPNEYTRGMARVPTVLGIKDLQNGAEDRNYRPLGCLRMMLKLLSGIITHNNNDELYRKDANVILWY